MVQLLTQLVEMRFIQLSFVKTIVSVFMISLAPYSTASSEVMVGYFDCDVKQTSLMYVYDDGLVEKFVQWEKGLSIGDKIRLNYSYDVLFDGFRFGVVDLYRDKKLRKEFFNPFITALLFISLLPL